MNKERRATLATILIEMDDISASTLTEAQTIAANFSTRVDALREQEDEAYGNIPENLMYTERAETMESNIDAFQTAVDILDEAVDAEDVDAVLENIQEAKSALEEIE